MGFIRGVLPWIIVLGPLADLLRSRSRPGRLVGGGSLAGIGAAVVGLALVPSDPDPSGVLAWDRLGGLVAAFVVAVTLMVRTNAHRSLALDPTRTRFDAGAAVIAALGALTALAAHPLALLVGWVATTPVVALLIRHDGRPSATAAARTAVRSLGAGDLALVAAVATATLVLDVDVLRAGEEADAGGPATVVALAVLVAAMARGALVPFHRWLAASVAAPTPLSALLHAGVVNAGGLLVVRWAGVLPGSAVVVGAGVVVAVTTIVAAGAVVRTRPDVKGGLVWSTVGQMGFMTLQAVVGLSGPAIAHLLGHGMYKAHLFLASGGALERRRQVAGPPDRAPWALAALSSAAVVAASVAVVRPHFLDAGVVALLPLAFLAATVASGLRPWLGAGRPGGTALMAAAAMTLGALTVTELVDRIVAPSLPAGVPPAASALSVLAIAAIAAGAATTARLVAGRTELAERTWVRLRSVGTIVPAPVR